MIDPNNVTNYNRTQRELEIFFLFSIFVAGKRSEIASSCLTKLLKDVDNPFEYLKSLNETTIRDALVAIGIGQYNRLTKCICDSVNLDLSKCSVNDLENIYGIGPKTARFFILHSRENARHAVLDTHILNWLRNYGVEKVPKATPQNRQQYKKLEDEFLKIISEKYPNMSIADVDLMIWKTQKNK